MTTPSPALFAGRKKPMTSAPKSDSSELSSEAKAKIERAEGKPKRVPRLLVNHPELEEIMARLKKDEQINKKHGWYDRNRNGKQRTPKGTKPRCKTNKEKN